MKFLLILIISFNIFAEELDYAKKLIANNDLFEAERVLKNINIKNPKNVEAVDLLFDIASTTNDLRLFKYINSLNIFKNLSNEIKIRVAKNYIYFGKFNEALNIVKGSDDLRLRVLEGTCLNALGRNIEAIKVLNIKPREKSEKTNLYFLTVARTYMILKKYSYALKYYQEIPTYSRYYIDAQKEIFNIFIKLKNYDDALDHVEALCYLKDEGLSDKDFLELKILEGKIYLSRKEFDRAESIFDLVLKEQKETDIKLKKSLKEFSFLDDLLSIKTENGVKNIKGRHRKELFFSNSSYSKTFSEWMTNEEKKLLISSFSVYYSLYNEYLRNTGDKSINFLKEELENEINNTFKILNQKILNRVLFFKMEAEKAKVDITLARKSIYREKLEKDNKMRELLIKKVD